MTKSPPPEQSLLLLLAVSITLGWRPLLDTFTLALREDQYTHIILILPLSAALILSEWRSLRPMVARNFRTGFPLLVIAVLLVGVVKWRSATLPSDVRLSIEMFALVLSWIAAFVLCFGSRVSRSVLFPLCFLFGLVPFPQ
ncbi:MAG: archaeosortase/exosortase family protein, partial [Terriglobales bacterium]